MAKQIIAANVPSKRKRKNEWFYFKQNAQLTLLALPAIAAFFIINYLPLYGLLLPFKDFNAKDGILGSPWVGLKNFRFLLTSDDILIAIRNTVLYNLVFIFVGMAVSVILALMLYEFGKKAVKVYQTAALVPYFMSWVVVAYVLNTLLDMDNGIFNNILEAFGAEPILWYNTPKYWPAILIITYIFKNAGYNAVVYFAALSGIDRSYFEAAQIDGASRLKQIYYISLPSIRSIIIIMTILNIGKIFYGDFGLFYNVTLNSPLLYSVTDIIDTYVYRALMQVGDLGMSSTTGFCQSVLGFILVLATNHFAGRIDPSSKMF